MATPPTCYQGLATISWSLKCQEIFSSAKRLAVPKLHPTTTPCLWISSGLHCSKLKINFVSPHSTKLRKYCTFEKYAGLAKLQVCYIASLRPEDMQRYRRRVSLPRKAPAGGRDLFNLMSEEVSALASDDYFFLQLFHEYDSRSFSWFFVGSPKAPLQDAHEVLWSIIMSHNAPRPSVPKNIWGWDKIPLFYWFKNKKNFLLQCASVGSVWQATTLFGKGLISDLRRFLQVPVGSLCTFSQSFYIVNHPKVSLVQFCRGAAPYCGWLGLLWLKIFSLLRSQTRSGDKSD